MIKRPESCEIELEDSNAEQVTAGASRFEDLWKRRAPTPHNSKRGKRQLGAHAAWASSLAAMLVALIACGLTGCNTTVPPAPEPEPDVEVITLEDRAMAKSLMELMVAAHDTPGREYANMLRTSPRAGWLRQLAGEENPLPEQNIKPGELSNRIWELKGYLKKIGDGLTWPSPKQVRVPKASGELKMDGKLDEKAWAAALTYTQSFKINKSDEAVDVDTTWKILWDDENFYFAFDCVDPDILAESVDRDGQVYAGDSVEMFILPDFRFRTYWELIISPAGSIYDSIQCKKLDQWFTDTDTDATIEGLDFGIDIRGTLNASNDEDDGYTIEVAVPFRELPGYTRSGPEAGHKLHLMLVRLDKHVGKLDVYSFQPLLSWGHNIWNHAPVELLGEPAVQPDPAVK